MSLNESIRMKLKKSASKVDIFIEELLKPRRPQSLYDAANYIIDAGGKRLRPYLVLRSCELVGGDEDEAVPFAAALEMLHNFTLIHDDIMDNDDLRRGAPTVHAKWGLPIAIASGDLLFAKVYEAMTKGPVKLPCDRIKACIERVTEATLAICEGQVLDVSFPHTSDISEEDYYLMVGEKTAALFKACSEIGAIVGGGSKKDIEQLGRYGWNAGIAFQIVDDYLGVTSDEETLGKPVGSDLREGKKTLIIIHALEHASPKEREIIDRVLGVKNADPGDIQVANEILRRIGSLSHSLEAARRYADEAKKSLDNFPDSDEKRDLLELVDYFMERTY